VAVSQALCEDRTANIYNAHMHNHAIKYIMLPLRAQVLVAHLVGDARLDAQELDAAVHATSLGAKTAAVGRFETWGAGHPLTGRVSAVLRARSISHRCLEHAALSCDTHPLLQSSTLLPLWIAAPAQFHERTVDLHAQARCRRCGASAWTLVQCVCATVSILWLQSGSSPSITTSRCVLVDAAVIYVCRGALCRWRVCARVCICV
jgi:hypothetical protein